MNLFSKSRFFFPQIICNVQLKMINRLYLISEAGTPDLNVSLYYLALIQLFSFCCPCQTKMALTFFCRMISPIWGSVVIMDVDLTLLPSFGQNEIKLFFFLRFLKFCTVLNSVFYMLQLNWSLCRS